MKTKLEIIASVLIILGILAFGYWTHHFILCLIAVIGTLVLFAFALKRISSRDKTGTK